MLRELHVFRGHQPSPTGFIMGHEFTGIVKVVGSKVKTVKVGDKIVSPFTVSWQVTHFTFDEISQKANGLVTNSLDCFYCKNGYSSRCVRGVVFGTAALDGAQAEFVRVPLADGTVMKAPAEINDKALVLMADIFPTGFFGASNAFKLLSSEQITESVVVVIGCGPVGLCAIIAAANFKPKHLFAIDSVDSRLELAKNLGAEPLNFQTNKPQMEQRIKAASDGRGADVVIEVVGLSPALRTAFDLIRPWGIISSIGVHNGEVCSIRTVAFTMLTVLRSRGQVTKHMARTCDFRWAGVQSDQYSRKRSSFFRKSSIYLGEPRSVVEEKKLLTMLSFMYDKIMPLSDAVEGYDMFDKMKAQKVIFEVVTSGEAY